MIRKIPRTQFREGKWPNGLGVAWEIAKEPSSDATFDWRFALARIDVDVPFSQYAGVDRIFMLLDGDGLDLDVQGQGRLQVHQRFAIHRFEGDAMTFCHLLGGACRSLNLFLARDKWRADAEVLRAELNMKLAHLGHQLVFVLQGEVNLDGEQLGTEDAAIATDSVHVHAATGDALLYVARLFPRG